MLRGNKTKEINVGKRKTFMKANERERKRGREGERGKREENYSILEGRKGENDKKNK